MQLDGSFALNVAAGEPVTCCEVHASNMCSVAFWGNSSHDSDSRSV